MDYFIHLADPGFPDPPWPGVRRLGPYVTPDEAQAQAAADAASGQGVALGIYDENGSEAMAHPISNEDEIAPVDPVVTTEQIQADADAIIRDDLIEKVRLRDERDAALNVALEGTDITASDMVEGGLLT